ncbi:MAG: ABC transporter permease [Haloarculaceae archaeon]
MSLGDALTRARWRVVDALVAAKRRLPTAWYRSPGDRFGHALVSPGMGLVSLLAVGLVLLAYYSVLTYDPYEVLIYEFSLASWTEFLTEPAYLRIFVRTFLMSAFVTVLAVALGFPYAYLTIRTDSALARKVLLAGVLVPFFTGVIVRAYGWLIVFGKHGFLNYVLSLVGLGPVQVVGTPIAVAVGLTQIMIPYSVLMIAPSIEAIDRSVEQAAKNLGAGPVATFRYVVLPLAKPGLTAAAVVTFTISMAAFSVPDFLGAGLFDFVANFVYSTLFNASNYPLASVMSLVLVTVTSLIVLVVFRYVGAGTMSLEGGVGRD